ncbi:MAG: non-homologous end-joining DNA ligase [Kofleriaceae bacterium]|nr:non-homologous end-joining DNA ligase [Kofleriaceae bacterium]
MELSFGDITVACTNIDRVVFPDAGLTKGDVLRYYADLADVIVPELRGRPLTIERFTKGIDKGGFYQKHAQKHYPPYIDREELGGKTRVVYPIVNDAAGLVYMVNQGGFVLHVWTSRRDTPWTPDLLVYDLDPPDGALALVRTGARIIRELLDQLELTTFVKTTGSKGLHVVAPLDGTATFDEVGTLCARINALLCARHPDQLTTEFYKKDRKGRLFLDTMRNTYGATVVAPYSLRGRPGAPVSAPIRWDELDTIAPDTIRLPDVRARLEAHGDPWRDLRARPGSVVAAAAALDRLPRP